MISSFSEIAFKSSAFDSITFSPSKVLTGVSSASDMEINISESGTDSPFSHLEIVCRTIFNLIASSSCESPFDFLIAFMFSLNIRDNLFSFSGTMWYHYCMRKCPLLQATHINIQPLIRKIPICRFPVASIAHSQEKAKGKRKSTNLLPKFIDFLASPARFERAAFRLGGECSILLSYGDRGIFSGAAARCGG